LLLLLLFSPLSSFVSGSVSLMALLMRHNFDSHPNTT
jgi:hypothetical protein